MKKQYTKLVPALMATAMVSAFAPTNLVFAQENDDDSDVSLPVLSVSSKESKEQIENKVALTQTLEDDSVSLEDLSLDDTTVKLNGFDPEKKGLQVVTAEIAVAKTNEDGTTSKSMATSSSPLAIEVEQDKLPNIKLKQESVTIDNGSTFVPSNFITVTPDDSGNLPILEMSNNVDTSTDGNYTATYTAKNSYGKTTVTLNVTVKTPEEVIRAREEAARAAEEARQKAEAEAKAKQEAAARAAAAQAAAQQAAAAAAAQANTNVTAQSDVASRIISIARSWVGRGRYVYGGTNPATGVDCSGFTQYVFAQVGISLNRVSNAQRFNGYQVSAAEAMPGDLCVWSGHVGIYSGNGMIINAENPGSGIREDPIRYFMNGASGSFYGYYRIPGVY